KVLMEQSFVLRGRRRSRGRPRRDRPRRFVVTSVTRPAAVPVQLKTNALIWIGAHVGPGRGVDGLIGADRVRAGGGKRARRGGEDDGQSKSGFCKHDVYLLFVRPLFYL